MTTWQKGQTKNIKNFIKKPLILRKFEAPLKMDEHCGFVLNHTSPGLARHIIIEDKWILWRFIEQKEKRKKTSGKNNCYEWLMEKKVETENWPTTCKILSPITIFSGTLLCWQTKIRRKLIIVNLFYKGIDVTERKIKIDTFYYRLG